MKKWLETLNYYFLQWFFIRLYYEHYDDDITETPVAWGILFPIVPMTGWNSEFAPGKYRKFQLLKVK